MILPSREWIHELITLLFKLESGGLVEIHEILQAIRQGEVDALMIHEGHVDKLVF